jgi:hypothetical protein
LIVVPASVIAPLWSSHASSRKRYSPLSEKGPGVHVVEVFWAELDETEKFESDRVDVVISVAELPVGLELRYHRARRFPLPDVPTTVRMTASGICHVLPSNDP